MMKRFRIAHHNNKMLFWHAATTHAVFSLMAGLGIYYFINNFQHGPTHKIQKMHKHQVYNTF